MRYYPQLPAGSICQFPISRISHARTIWNESTSGYTLRMSQPAVDFVEWQLQYSNLTDEEGLSIGQLFEAAEGRLETFVFLDPMDNLLTWSEDWSKPVWTADPLLQVSLDIDDPLGGRKAAQLTNVSQTAQRIFQSTQVPSWFQYCFSVYLRSDSDSNVELTTASLVEDRTTPVRVTSAWARFAVAPKLPAAQDGIRFGLQVPAGVSLQVFGAQLEAQPAAGTYKATTDRAGVYPSTRFNSDLLWIGRDAPNQNLLSLRLISALR